MPSQRLALLGSTGSLGTQVLEVVRALRRQGLHLEVVALAAGRNIPRLAEQIKEFRPALVAVQTPQGAEQLRALLPSSRLRVRVEVLHGREGLIAVASAHKIDLVVNALVGAVGLAPTLAALEAHKGVALANKESLVIGGALVRAAQCAGGRLLPIDSEHSALFQLLEGRSPDEVERLILTASGGALVRWPLEELPKATPADVLRHPNWAMGPRITVDSATLVNKAFEVIEAHHLFDLPFERISAVLHPESRVHGLVRLCDGSLLAHLGVPDMRVPIQYALTYPQRRPAPAPSLALRGAWHFDEIDVRRYPAFALGVEAGRRGGTFPAVFNAADEVLVERFLRREIPFTAIAQGLEAVLEQHEREHNTAARPPLTLEAIEEADAWAREAATRFDMPDDI